MKTGKIHLQGKAKTSSSSNHFQTHRFPFFASGASMYLWRACAESWKGKSGGVATSRYNPRCSDKSGTTCTSSKNRALMVANLPRRRQRPIVRQRNVPGGTINAGPVLTTIAFSLIIATTARRHRTIISGSRKSWRSSWHRHHRRLPKTAMALESTKVI